MNFIFSNTFFFFSLHSFPIRGVVSGGPDSSRHCFEADVARVDKRRAAGNKKGGEI